MDLTLDDLEVCRENRRYRVLAIDDDEAILQTYQTIFSRESDGLDGVLLQFLNNAEPQKRVTEREPVEIELDCVDSGEEGVQRVIEAREAGAPYALIYLDIRMIPGMDGVQTAAEIRKVDPMVRIILISAYSDYSEYDIRKKIGVEFHYLKKPFQHIELHQLTYLLIESWCREQTLRLTNQRLEEAIETEQRLRRVRDEFFATMSHELRTPLASIINNSEYLADQESDPDRKGILNAIENAGRGQLAVINDILDMSKIESGKFSIEEAPFDLNQLVRDIHAMFSVRALAAGLEFTVDLQHREDHLILGDRQRIAQILINLLGNALKFTEQGSVRVCCWIQENWISFTVEDTGIGMSAATVERLFQRYQQGDETISARFGGTGLGLYISRQLAELMGGEIEVSSIERVGSTFVLRLPYRPTAKRTAPQRRVQTSFSRFSGTVLLVEDTLQLQQVERLMLEKMGLEVTVANHGQEALERVAEGPFDLILMDMLMPVMGGREATRELQQQGCGIPVVALTANLHRQQREEFEQAGAVGFLEKPLNKRELIRVLQRYLTAVE